MTSPRITSPLWQYPLLVRHVAGKAVSGGSCAGLLCGAWPRDRRFGLARASRCTLDSLPVTGIPVPYVRDVLDRCKAHRKVLILDACHSGAGRDVAAMSPSFRQVLDSDKGMYTIASCDADQASYEWPENGHGAFTHFMTEGLRQAAPANTAGDVTLDALYEWTHKSLSDWASSRRVKQEPIRICRTKGSISIAHRSLTLEEQLQQAKAEITDQECKIHDMEDTVERVQIENERLRHGALGITERGQTSGGATALGEVVGAEKNRGDSSSLSCLKQHRAGCAWTTSTLIRPR